MRMCEIMLHTCKARLKCTHIPDLNSVTRIGLTQPIYLRHVPTEQELCSAFNDTIAEGSPGVIAKQKKFTVLLPSWLVKSFFVPSISAISECLRRLKNDSALSSMRYVFLVGGFSSCPLVQDVARKELGGDGCIVLNATRPEVAIVQGAVLFPTHSRAFRTRKARLTYGIRSTAMYDHNNPAHVKRRSSCLRVSQGQPEMIPVFSAHIRARDDVPSDGVCKVNSYSPLSPSQGMMRIEILASDQSDVGFPDERSCFIVGWTIVAVDRQKSFEQRGINVQFMFSGIELFVSCFQKDTGERVKYETFTIIQDVQQA